jgi:hypothetical protein
VDLVFGDSNYMLNPIIGIMGILLGLEVGGKLGL